MADPPRYSNGEPDTDLGPEQGSSTRMPRWAKIFGIIAIVVVLLFVIMLVAGGGRHGPGRHRHTKGGPSGQTLSATTEVSAPPETGDS